jgi:hypothetical protein
MSQNLKAILDAEINDALGYVDTETIDQRTEALQAYLRQPYGNEVEGKSQIVTGEVAEAIDGALPPLVRIFSASDEVVRFEPRGPQDERGAKQATDYCNWVFQKENQGVLILHDWFKDALMQKVGVVKAYWDESEDLTTERYQNLSDDELALLLSDDSVEITEQETFSQEVATPMGVVIVNSYNVKIQKKSKVGRVRIENIPPEEFLISKRAKQIQDSPFVAHRRLMTRSDLIAMGFEKNVIDSLPTSDSLTFTEERLARFSNGEQPTDPSLDFSMQTVEVFECYIKADTDGKGIASLKQVFYAGNEILSEEETDYVPFHSLCPIPIPHKFFGNSLADRTVDLQLIKTTLTRQILDNLYLTNNARVTAVDGQVNLDDLLTSTAGGVIRVKSQGAVSQLNVQPVANQAFPMLSYLDQVQQKRTGVTDASQGLDPSILQNVTAAAVASMQQASAGKIEMIARIFAETGVKSLFKGILHLLCKYQDKPRMIRLRGEYVPFDPREWSNQYDVDVNVGLGAGNRQEQMAMLTMILAKQEQMLAQFGLNNPLVSLTQYRGTLGRMIEAAGFKDSAEFFKPIDPMFEQAMAQPQPPQPDPVMQAQMAKAQADIQVMQAKAQADIQLAREKAAADLQLQQQKFMAEMEMRRQEFEAEAQLKAMKVGAGITSNVEIPG